MKTKPNESGITLIALIITIIVLVILAAVSISAVYNSNLVGYATNGALNYAEEANRENEILGQTESIIQSAVNKINDITGGSSSENPGGDGGDEGEDPETPPEEPESGINFGDLSEDEINAMVGKYVDYTPVSGAFTSEGQYNGNGNQPFSTISSLKWRILDASDSTLTLISDQTANTNFTLYGYNGYNNGVLLLNNACKSMYSNNNLGAIGRSLNIEDVEAVSKYDGNQPIESTTSYTYYPNIFAIEKNGAPNDIYGTELGLSDQTDYVIGYTNGSSLKGLCTYYSYTMGSNYFDDNYLELFIYQPGTKTNLNDIYWLASRCVEKTSITFNFSISYIGNGTLDAEWLYESSSPQNSINNTSHSIRPVVEIDLTKVNVGLTGDGGVDTPYSIEAK